MFLSHHLYRGKEKLELLPFEHFLQGFEISRAFLRAKQVGEKCTKIQNPVEIAHKAFALFFLFPSSLGIKNNASIYLMRHATSSKRGPSERFTTKLSKPDLDRLLNKAFRAPSFGGGCVIPITLPFWIFFLKEMLIRFGV